MKKNWMEFSSNEVMAWLLEPDEENAPVRFLTLRDLLERDVIEPELKNARAFMMAHGPIPEILSNQHKDGYWDRQDTIYYTKYRGTSWQIILLAQMGADKSNEQISKGCEFLLDHAIGDHGGFSMNGRQSGAANCLQGNLAAALLDLGYKEDLRVMKAIEWMARSVTGDGFNLTKKENHGMRYLRSGISGPGFLCSANDHQPCAWGAVKVALAFSKIPDNLRTQQINNAISSCIDFLVSVNPATADYPHPYGKNPSTSWFKIGFPVFYVTDVLQILEALVALGLIGDPRLQNAVELVLEKRDKNLRWPMEYTYNGKIWVDIEEKGEPSKWVTFRALKMLKGYFS
ncbi:MAG TPA: hypothetical protein VMW28_09695 [Pelolinea sp.]|nr:hypothetical protein [Pelolinea sp.]